MTTTITFEKSMDMMHFLQRCVYMISGRTDAIPRFSKMEVWPCFNQIITDDNKSKEEIESLLKENKIKYKWVNQI